MALGSVVFIEGVSPTNLSAGTVKSDSNLLSMRDVGKNQKYGFRRIADCRTGELFFQGIPLKFPVSPIQKRRVGAFFFYARKMPLLRLLLVFLQEQI